MNNQRQQDTAQIPVANIWMPQPGPQAMAVTCPADQILFGGSRGGGKTDCAIGRQIIGAMRHGHGWNGLFVRKNYKHFHELRRRIDELIRGGLPARRVGGATQTNYIYFENGAQIMFTAIQSADQLDFFLGSQFTELSVEEATSFPFISELIDKLNGCLRSPHGIKCTMFMTSNPGGPGHNYIKTRYISPEPMGGVPIKDHEDADTKVFIPSNVDDNQVLMQNDPAYRQKLESIEDPNLRRAWLFGDWDVILGGFFDDIWNQQKSKIILPPFRPPKHWDRLVGFDWGSARPFSVGWYAISGGEYIPELGKAIPRGSLVRFAEWYGCVKDQPNTGIRMESRDVARRIIDMEERYGFLGNGMVDRIADPAIFKQEDGPSIAEKMAEQGVVFRRGDNKRVPGWDVMRSLMRGEMSDWETMQNDDGEQVIINAVYEPRLYITENCKAWIRTVPVLEREEKDPEDVDTDGEDHIADETRYVCASRPGKGTSDLDQIEPKTPMELEHEEIAAIVDHSDDIERPVLSGDLADDPQKDAISAEDEDEWGGWI